MMKYVNIRENSLDKIKKEDFESVVMFLSSYNKAKDMNARLHNLLTVVEERNSEKDFTDVLQYKERLCEFVDQSTDLLSYEPYYEYFSTSKEQLKDLDVDWVSMLSSSRGIMQTGLTIPSKSVACIRLDDLYAITPDYSPLTGEFEGFLEPLERMTTQLFGRMARTDKKGTALIKKNTEAYVKGEFSTRKK